MNKNELIAAVAAKTGSTKVAAAAAIDAITESIVEAVAAKDTVTLVGFGTFKASERQERMGRNPKTGKSIKIGATNTPKFTAGATFKTKVANGK